MRAGSGEREDDVRDAMRHAHVPPPAIADDPSTREWAWEFHVPVPPDALWNVVSDTSRVNRALGLSRMEFEERDGQLRGRDRVLGIEQSWVEEPWAWTAGRELTSVRRYDRGIARAVFAAYELTPEDGGRGTRFRVYFAWKPRGLIGRLLVGLSMRWLGRRYAELVADLASKADRLALPPPAPPSLAPAAEARLDELARQLAERPLDRRCVDALVALVRHGDELSLDRIAPLEQARVAGVDPHGLVEACLHATRLGLLDLRWDVVCPLCRGARATVAKLGELPRESRCDVCSVDFATSDAHAVEITFRPHPAVRSVENRFYCSAEPATKRHIAIQRTLAPGATTTVATALAPGRYRVRRLGDARFGFVDVSADRPSEQTLELTCEAVDRELHAGPSPTLNLIGRRDEPTTFVVETPDWSDMALRPGRVLSMQGFRDLFADAYLAADLRLEVGEQTVLFTDIVSSTAFYAANGDPAAFAVVKTHFDTLFAIVAAHRGAVVKTIGDATMAAFPEPVDALRASAAMQAAFGGDGRPTTIRIRVSLHTGPCIAVQFHQGIDYFGGTVNLAAKLQSLAGAGHVVLSRRTFDAPGVRAMLEAERADLVDVEYESSALGGSVPAKRWRTASTPPDA